VTELDVMCTPIVGEDAWTCRVTVDVAGGSRTEHRVRVEAADLERLDPGARDPHLLVDRSFRFLLAREPATSILHSFDLLEIARYFPEYEAEMRRET